MSLNLYGWNSLRDNEISVFEGSGLYPGRIISSSRGIYTIITESGEARAELSGSFRYKAISNLEYPVVGDLFSYVEKMIKNAKVIIGKDEEKAVSMGVSVIVSSTATGLGLDEIRTVIEKGGIPQQAGISFRRQVQILPKTSKRNKIPAA